VKSRTVARGSECNGGGAGAGTAVSLKAAGHHRTAQDYRKTPQSTTYFKNLVLFTADVVLHQHAKLHQNCLNGCGATAI